MRAGRASVAAVCALAWGCTPSSVPRAGDRPRACPHDAIAKGATCACLPGLTLLEGACVGESEVAAYCEVSARTGGAGTCETPGCGKGDAIDLARGTCIPMRSVRALARDESEVPVPEDMALGCHEGHTLVVRGVHIACLPLADTCPRGTAWDPAPARCLAPAACEPGAIRSRPCVPLVSASAGGGGGVVDIARWARAMLGTDGGEGTPRLCTPLRQRPWDFDVSPGGARTIALSVELVFPDNDVTELTLRAQALDATTLTPLGGEAPRAAEAALSSLLVPLRALGGSADVASATLRVTCVIPGGSSPLALPR